VLCRNIVAINSMFEKETVEGVYYPLRKFTKIYGKTAYGAVLPLSSKKLSDTIACAAFTKRRHDQPMCLEGLALKNCQRLVNVTLSGLLQTVC
jgi:hypothetical protein